MGGEGSDALAEARLQIRVDETFWEFGSEFYMVGTKGCKSLSKVIGAAMNKRLAGLWGQHLKL